MTAAGQRGVCTRGVCHIFSPASFFLFCRDSYFLFERVERRKKRVYHIVHFLQKIILFFCSGKKQRRPGSLGFWKDITLALASKEKRERPGLLSQEREKKGGKKKRLGQLFFLFRVAGVRVTPPKEVTLCFCPINTALSLSLPPPSSPPQEYDHAQPCAQGAQCAQDEDARDEPQGA